MRKVTILVFTFLLITTGCAQDVRDAFGRNALIQEISFAESERQLYVGDVWEPFLNIVPEADPGSRLVWQSDNPSVADVVQGTITAVGEGTATISVSVSRSSLKATVQVVVRNGDVNAIILNQYTLTLRPGETAELQGEALPEYALDKSLQWTSNNPEIVTVDGHGKITAKAPGAAEVTATAHNGIIASCKVTVEPILVEAVTLNSGPISLSPGQTFQLKASISPGDATAKTLTWSSSNPNVARVSQAGLVTAIASGSATITVTSRDGQKTALCQVTVRVPVSGLSLNHSSISSTADKRVQPRATITPANATDTRVTWSSSNSALAVVNAKGLVEARGIGTVTITARSTDGGFTARSTVTFTMPNTGGLSAAEKRMVDLINNQRSRAGLAPLQVDKSLLEVARLKSTDLIIRNYFSHTSPHYGTPMEMMRNFGISFRWAGENLAFNSCIERAHGNLMTSAQGHRENILNANYTHIGLGIRQKSNGTYYITQMFIGR
jgi:uncharacterized YkwD family protein